MSSGLLLLLNFRFLSAHEVGPALGPNKCRGLPFFHAFAWCDSVSCFSGRGKKTAWRTWKACDEITNVTTLLCALSTMPNPSVVDENIDVLEHFVVLLYGRTSSHMCGNEARKPLFTQMALGRSIDGLRPNQDALRQHISRVAYYARVVFCGCCWGGGGGGWVGEGLCLE